MSDVKRWLVTATKDENGCLAPAERYRWIGDVRMAVVSGDDYDRDVAALREERDKLAATVERVKALSHFHAMNAWGDVVGYVVRVADLDRVLAGPEPRVERRERTSDRRQARDDA